MSEAVRAAPRARSGSELRRPAPPTIFAVRFALGACAAIWIGHLPALVTNEPQWILITVLVVMQPAAGASFTKGALRLVGTAVAFVTAIALFGWYAQDPPWLLAGLFTVHAVAAYGFTGTRYQYAWFVWAFTTAIVLGGAMAGGDVETIAFQRASMVTIGVLLVLAIESLVWPSRPEQELRRSLAARARELAERLRRPGAGGADASPLVAQIELLEVVRSDLTTPEERSTALSHVALLLEALASRERSRGRTEAGAVDRTVAAALDEAAASLEEDRAPSPLFTEDRSDLTALARRLEQELRALHGEDADALPNLLPQAPAPTRLQVDPFRVQIALRCGIAVCLATLVPLSLGWGSNMLVAPVAFLLAVMPTRGGATGSLVLLAAMVLFGWLMADLALVYFTSEVHRLPAALAYPAVLAGGTAWLGMRSPKLALLPIMGGLIALLPVFSGTAAPTDVYGPYNTVCYMAVGLGSGWLATRLFWPATATRLLCLRVAGLLDLYREALASGRLADRRQRAALLLAHTRQTAQIAPLHAQARYEPVEDGLDEARRLELLRRVQELFDAVFAARPSTEAGDALLASLAACAAVLRGEPEVPTSGPLAADGPLGDVIARQLELEAWVADWQAARSA